MLCLPTCPLRNNKIVADLLKKWNQNHKPIFSAVAYDFPTQFAFTISKDKSKWTPITDDSPLLLGNTRSQDMEKTYRPNGAIYLQHKDNIKNSSLYVDTNVFIMNREDSIDIDTELDFQICENILEAKKKLMIDKKYPGLTVSIPLFFNQDESIDYQTLSKYLKELGAQKHISAIYSMAFNTRYRMLSDEELLNLNKEIIRISKDNGLDCYVGHPYIFDKGRLETYLREIATSKPAGISMLYPELYYNIDKAYIRISRNACQIWNECSYP